MDPTLPTKFRADLPTEYDPVAGIILPPERPYRWYRTTTYTDNNRANMHTIHRPTDSANTPAIYERDNDRADTPTINQPTDRQALCLTTITTAAGTVLPPEQTLAALPAANRPLLLCLQPTDFYCFHLQLN